MLGVKHRIGGYRVIAPIGAGGFATVFRAIDEKTGKEVAIKVLAENHSLVPDTRRRFEEEMGLLMTIKNPSIAKIYKVGETETGQPFMVLELADRGDLRRRLEEIRGNHQVLNREDLAMLAHHLYDGLRHLHGMEIVHRDVSPGNILIRSRKVGEKRAPGITLLEPGERFLLTDLGHAKDMILASGFTAGGGTRGFASPEQRDDVTVVDHRADIFAATAIVEWAAHDGLYAEALDPFFDVGLAAEPDERFDSMEEWHTSFSETMAATMLDGSQRSKVGRVIRKLTHGEPSAIDGLEEIDLDAIRPEMLVAEKVVRPPGGVTPPGMTGQTKVVLPPGSPGGHSIARPSADQGSATDRAAVSTGRTADTTVEAAEEQSEKPPNKPAARGASPPTRVDPETLIDAAVAADDEERRLSRPRGKGRRIVLAVVGLIVAGTVAFGLAQELGNRTVTDGAGVDAAGTAAQINSTSETTTTAGEPPADLLVATGSVAPDGKGDAGEDSEGQAEFSNGSAAPDDVDPARIEGTDGDTLRPWVVISSPEEGEQLSEGPLTVTGTATAPQGIERVEISIRNLDTLEYWNPDAVGFGPRWATAEAEPTEEGATTLSWTIAVPEEQLSAGTHQIRTWVRSNGNTVAPRNDSRTITVVRETEDG